MTNSLNGTSAGISQLGSQLSNLPLVVKGGVAGIIFILIWLTGYFIGIFPWLGYRTATESNFGVGKVQFVGNNKAGLTLGITKLPLMRGQKLYVNYDVDIKTGSLQIWLYRPGFYGSGHRVRISQSGKGKVTFPVKVTGLYKLQLRGWSDNKGRGWDLSYTATWGAIWRSN